MSSKVIIFNDLGRRIKPPVLHAAPICIIQLYDTTNLTMVQLISVWYNLYDTTNLSMVQLISVKRQNMFCIIQL